jgi:TonB-dependent SusC/RagA subfamily outer membrane receptor
MKLTFILLLFGLMTFASASYSQSKRLTFETRNASIETVFKQIESMSEYKFAYNSTKLDIEKKVSLKVENQTIDAILDKILGSANFSYRIVDRYIIITDDNALGLNSLANGQQVKKITGIVKDSGGNPLPGVSVVVKGTTNGTITDSQGGYSIPNVPENAFIQFSFVGMRAQEVKVGIESSYNVTLIEESIGIEEVVAVGYGVQKKTSVTGAISSVSGRDVSQVPVASLQSAIQGKVTGVTVVNNGAPGTNPIVRIRGNGSISYAADPLYIIDGTAATDISNFSSNDIESIEILKDAASTAVYGSRAANGVILITTKRGKKDGDAFGRPDSHPERSDCILESVHEQFMYAFLHIETIGAHTSLARIAKLARHSRSHRGSHISIVEYNQRRMAAEFQ